MCMCLYVSIRVSLKFHDVVSAYLWSALMYGWRFTQRFSDASHDKQKIIGKGKNLTQYVKSTISSVCFSKWEEA